MHGPLLPFVSFQFSSAVLTDNFRSEIFVFLSLFGVLLQEDDGVRNSAVLQKLCAQGGQLQGDGRSEDPG